jgi:hypothetical protein
VKNHLIIIVLLLAGLNGFGQEKGYFVLEPSYAYYKQHEINFALVRSINVVDHVVDLPLGYIGPFISGGINIADNRNLLVTKAGLVGFVYFIGARVSIINHTDFNVNQFSFRPEIGLTLFGYVSATYCYNFKLSNRDTFNIEGHVITFSIGFEPFLLKDKKYKQLFDWKS